MVRIDEVIRKCRKEDVEDPEKHVWCVYSHRTGRLLGRYRTKAEAERRLRQIEYFKHAKKDEVFGLLKRWRDKREQERLERKWEKVWGIDIGKAGRWKEVISDPEIAYEWYLEGFTPAEAKKWIAKGFLSVRGAVDWIDLGFTPAEAKKWNEVGVVDAFEAAEWEELGLGPKDVIEWKRAGVPTEEAGKWMMVEFDAWEAARWIRRGLTVDDAIAYKSKKARGVERKEMGVSVEDEWIRVVANVIVKQYRNEGRLLEDLELVRDSYGAESEKDLKRAFIVDWLKDKDVKRVLVKYGRDDVGMGDVDRIADEVREGLRRKGIDFDGLVREVVKGGV